MEELPFQLKPTSPPPPPQAARLPLGPTFLPQGVQFQFFSRDAAAVRLLLFADPASNTPSHTQLMQRFGDLWTSICGEAKPGMGYAFEVQATQVPMKRDGANFHIDPYAPCRFGHREWGVADGICEKGVLPDEETLHFHWGDDRFPRVPLSESIVYEVHLRGFTASETAGTRFPGSFPAFEEKIPYLKDLGVTAVEFLPIHHFNELEYHEGDSRHGLRNFWGYSTQGFFAPMSRYGRPAEFKSLVKALHAAGIEVWLDVVYNHTGQAGNGLTPALCPPGPPSVDEDVYYIKHDGHHTNYSGCGNTVNCNHPVVRRLIVESLRHWVSEYHIDGFRFDLASIMCRGRDGGMLGHPPLIDVIDEDPMLRDTKMIAEAWDAAGAYQVGHFPSKRWSEWNGKYRDDVRRFWTGEQGILSGFATRLTGSEDLFLRPGQSPLKSINFITCHDGFTLRDLVSYNGKHNEANREDNRDGDSNNHSRNFGEEGPTDNAKINAKRLKMQKNMLATLFLSHGVPMLTAGDEFGRTQGGNNNGYCQDNEVAWVNWDLLEENAELHAFTRGLIALRKRFAVLRPDRFLGEASRARVDEPFIQWFGREAENGDKIYWDNYRDIAVRFRGQTGQPDVFVVFNAGNRAQTYWLPSDVQWRLEFCTDVKGGTKAARNGGGFAWRAPMESVSVFVEA